MILLCYPYRMGTMVKIDDALLAKAREITGTHEAEALVETALRALIARQAALDIIALGGTDPDAWAPNEGDEPPI